MRYEMKCGWIPEGIVYSVIFDIEKRRFVKPEEDGSVALPLGSYFEIAWFSPNIVEVILFHVRVDTEHNVVIREEEAVPLRVTEQEVTNPILRDFVTSKPSYPHLPALDFEKVYNEEAVQEIIDAIKRELSLLLDEVGIC